MTQPTDKTRVLPREMNMPSLDHLGRNMDLLSPDIGAEGSGRENIKAGRHLKNFVRLVDVARREYAASRSDLERCLPGRENANLGVSFHSAVEHLEFCVVTAIRAIDTMRVLKGLPQLPPMDRDARRSVERFDGTLREVRNTICHVEGHSAEFEDRQWHALVPSVDTKTASIGACEISLAQLSSAIERLHGYASVLTAYRETPSEMRDRAS